MKYSCIVQNRWMWSLEGAFIGLKSPTGNAKYLYKMGGMDNLNEEQRKLVWHIAEVEDGGTIELTKEEMLAFKEITKVKRKR